MDPSDSIEADPMPPFIKAFGDQLLACLAECARGRRGLFTEQLEEEHAWPQAANLRQLALALQTILAQQEEQNALCNEFLDLCTIHGESDPGEPRLARAFLARIERGEVGNQAEGQKLPW